MGELEPCGTCVVPNPFSIPPIKNLVLFRQWKIKRPKTKVSGMSKTEKPQCDPKTPNVS